MYQSTIKMLNTSDIKRFLRNRKDFLGVFAIDKLPIVLAPKPSGLVINLDESFKPGSHWVAVYLPKNGPAHYFDPFGAPPPHNIAMFLDRNSKTGWTFNASKFQGELSYLCGYYCVMFIKFAPNFELFYQKLNSCNYDKNDFNVLKFFN